MQTYLIRRTLLVPLGLLLLTSLLLLGVCIAQGEARPKVVLLALVIVPIAVLFIECIWRRVELGPQGLTAYRLLRTKTLAYAEIDAVETITVKRRVFLTLCAGDEFLILSNAYARFPELVLNLLERVPETAISPEARAMAAAPPVRSLDFVSCWLATVLMLGILAVQLHSPW